MMLAGNCWLCSLEPLVGGGTCCHSVKVLGRMLVSSGRGWPGNSSSHRSSRLRGTFDRTVAASGAAPHVEAEERNKMAVRSDMARTGRQGHLHMLPKAPMRLSAGPRVRRRVGPRQAMHPKVCTVAMSSPQVQTGSQKWAQPTSWKNPALSLTLSLQQLLEGKPHMMVVSTAHASCK